MFDFRSLELVHWDYWQRFTLPMDANIITVVGPNGSGKTTLLDALRTLLTIDCAGNRDYKNYLRHNGRPYAWLRAVVGNPQGPTGSRPFFPLMDPLVTLAVRIQKKGGEWNRQYAVVAGDVSIEQLEQRNDWLGLRDYRVRLEGAGLSQAIRRVLSLEQGATDKLCQLPPKALLDLVFDVFGDKAVLDDYQRARSDQHEAERELGLLGQQLAQLGLSLEQAEARARSYQEWQALKDERVQLESQTLPRIELAEQRSALLGGQAALVGLRRRHADAVEQLDQQHQAIARLDDDAAEAVASAQRAEQAHRAATEAFTAARVRFERNEVIVQQHAHLLQQVAADADADLGALARQLETDRERFAVVGQREYQVKHELAQLENERSAWQSGRRHTPEFETTFRRALEQAGIGHRMLSETVEVTDPQWQGAVEAVLAGSRHVVLLDDPADQRRAYQLGEQHRYRHFVVADREKHVRPSRGSLLEVIAFDAPPPDWLVRQLDRIRRVDDVDEGSKLPRDQDWITPQGYFRERRGGRHMGVEDFYFGKAARELQLRRGEQRRQTLDDERRALRDERGALQQRIADAESRLKGIDSADQLAARAEEFALAAAQRRELEDEGVQALAAHQSSDTALKVAREVMGGYDKQRVRIEAAIEQARRQVLDHERLLQQQRGERAQRIADYRRRRAGMPPQWRNPQALAELRERFESPQAVRREIDRLERRLADGHWQTDDTCLPLRDKLASDHETLKHDLDARHRHLERGKQIIEDARGAYLNVLRATVRQYSRNLRFLAELAGIGVEVDQPEIANDDLALAQLGLSVRFEFDKKGWIGLDDGEASGGQQVMKSLLLLVALMRDEHRPGGFVFIDEPFAHLDIFNIDKVGAFLKQTRAQYVLTTPNTHNVNVFQPSELTLCTSKRRPGSPWAQPVAVLRRALGDIDAAPAVTKGGAKPVVAEA